MWPTFFIGTLIFLFSVFVPGYMQVRSVGFQRTSALAFAPLCSVSEYALLGAAFGLAGISVSSYAIYAILFAASVVFSICLRKKKFVPFAFERYFDWRILLVYVSIGVLLGIWVFVRNLDGAYSFVQEFDNGYHLNAIAAFSSIGRFSFLQSTSSPTGVLPFSDISFYPAAWHVLVALLANAFQLQATIAENIGIFSFLSFVYPISWFAFLSVLFRGSKRPIFAGAICAFIFASFPWGFIAYGPLYSNFASFALLPGVLTLFLVLFFGAEGSLGRIRIGAVFVAGVLSIALAQTNAIFTAVIILTPLAALGVYGAANNKSSKRTSLIFAFGFVLFVVAILALCYKLPIFNAVVHNPYVPYTQTVFQGFIDYLDLGYRNSVAQPLVAFLVCFGIFYVLVKKTYRWLLVPLIYFMFAYVSAGSVPGGILHDFLSGFWYNDVDRIAADAAFLLIPLSALGFEAIFVLLGSLESNLASMHRVQKPSGTASAFVCLLVTFLIFLPNYISAGNGEVKTAFGERTCRLASLSSTDKSLTDNEIGFMVKVKSIVGDAVVINDPYDGSAFAYAVNDLNILFRSFHASLNENGPAATIRKYLNEFAVSSEVREAVEETGADYLLQLDAPVEGSDISFYYAYYDESLWEGIDSVDDSTPGFSLVLSDGDMRLYKIGH